MRDLDGTVVLGDGGVGDLAGDAEPVIRAAISNMKSLHDAPNVPTGETLLIPAGRYRLRRPLVIDRHIRLVGETGSSGSPSTRFEFAPGSPGIVIAPGAASTIVENIALYSGHIETWTPQTRYSIGDLVAPTKPNGNVYERIGAPDRPRTREPRWPGRFEAAVVDTPKGRIRGGWKPVHAAGVIMLTKARLDNLKIENFAGHGISVYGNVREARAGNTSGWRVDSTQTIVNHGSGLFVEGRDANAGVVVGLSSSLNRLWGVHDNSFLGNTYVGCHAADNDQGPYLSENINAANVFVGCYSEGPHAEDSVKGSSGRGRTVFLGGQHGAQFRADNTATIIGSRPAGRSGPQTIRSLASGGQVETRLGEHAPIVDGNAPLTRQEMPAFGFGFESNDGHLEIWQNRWNLPTARFGFTIRRDPVQEHQLTFTGRDSFEQGKVVLPSGIQLGMSRQAPVSVSSDRRFTQKGTHFVGDQWLRSTFKENEPWLGMVCVRAGEGTRSWGKYVFKAGDRVSPSTELPDAYFTCTADSSRPDEPNWDDATAAGETVTDTNGVEWIRGYAVQGDLGWEAPHRWAAQVDVELHDLVTALAGRDLFVYRAVLIDGQPVRGVSGQTGGVEPRWPTGSLTAEVEDGAVTWQTFAWRSQPSRFRNFGPIDTVP